MWLWAKKHSVLVDAEIATSQTWFVWGSENHHLQRLTTCWHFAKLLAQDARYRQRPFDDGALAAAHHAAWTAYAKEFLRQRAMKGLFIETANGSYGFRSLKGIYNIFDFSHDPVLKQRAGYLLDLYWATWAEEQLDNVRGGGKARIYAGLNSTRGNLHPIHRLAWYTPVYGIPASGCARACRSACRRRCDGRRCPSAAIWSESRSRHS